MKLKLALPNGGVLKVDAKFPYRTSPIGYRVLVGGKTAVVVSLADEGEAIDLQFPDEKPFTTEKHLKAVVDTANHYGLMPWRFLFELMPAHFDWREEEYITLGKKEWRFIDKKSKEVLDYVKSRKEVREELLKEKFGRELVEKLMELGFIKSMRAWKVPELKRTFYSLAVPAEEAVGKLRGLKNREEKIRLIYYLQENRIVSDEDIKSAGFSQKDLKALLRRGLIKETEEGVEGVKLPEVLKQETRHYIKPLGNRSVVFGSLEGLLSRLEGELDRVVEEGKKAFVFCDSQTVLEFLRRRLYSLLGDRLITLTSNQNPREFIQNWFSLSSSGGLVVLGSRVALLAPFSSLDLIVCFGSEFYSMRNGVDPRHFLYQTSLYYGAHFSVFSPMLPLNLYSKKDWQKEYYPPEGEVILLRRKGDEVLSPELKNLLRDKRDCLFLVNKTGYSYGFCKFCGWMAECPSCGSFLTLSKDMEGVFCTSCRYKGEAKCPECGRPLQELGFGIDKAVEEVQKVFGEREDFHFDTTPRFVRTYQHVIILHADNILSVPWFDSAERYFLYLWTALCVSKKSLIVQTVLEDNPVLNFIQQKDWQAFCQEELKRREEEELPPFKRLVVARTKDSLDLKDMPVEVRKRKLNNELEFLIKVDNKHLGNLLRHIRKNKLSELRVF
ncbi:MAG: hypothetical protein RMI51_04995 [Aquificaceae bacterium]|nr:hypothetical protein [Aquificaceae bacterium]